MPGSFEDLPTHPLTPTHTIPLHPSARQNILTGKFNHIPFLLWLGLNFEPWMIWPLPACLPPSKVIPCPSSARLLCSSPPGLLWFFSIPPSSLQLLWLWECHFFCLQHLSCYSSHDWLLPLIHRQETCSLSCPPHPAACLFLPYHTHNLNSFACFRVICGTFRLISTWATWWVFDVPTWLSQGAQIGGQTLFWIFFLWEHFWRRLTFKSTDFE